MRAGGAAARCAAGAIVAGAVALAAAPVAADAAAAIAGPRPTYTDREPTVPPNDAAIVIRAWAPGIDDGYVPQGVTATADAVYLSAYREGGAGRRCRVFRLDPASALETGAFDLPADCGHAGGLASDGAGRLFVVDTWKLYEVDLARAFDAAAGDAYPCSDTAGPARVAGTAGRRDAAAERPGTYSQRVPAARTGPHGAIPPVTEHACSDAAVTRTVSLRFPLRGSFVTLRDGALWIGEYRKPQGGTLRVVPLAAVAAATEPAGLGPGSVTRSLPLAPAAQGAAFAPDGTLWLSLSTSQYGRLQRLDPATGAVLAEMDMVAGLEDLGIGPDGLIWSVSEAGARRWHNWPTYFPLVIAIDPSRLR